MQHIFWFRFQQAIIYCQHHEPVPLQTQAVGALRIQSWWPAEHTETPTEATDIAFAFRNWSKRTPSAAEILNLPEKGFGDDRFNHCFYLIHYYLPFLSLNEKPNPEPHSSCLKIGHNHRPAINQQWLANAQVGVLLGPCDAVQRP